MSDNRFNYIHMTDAALKMLDDDEDETILNEPLPEEGQSAQLFAQSSWYSLVSTRLDE